MINVKTTTGGIEIVNSKTTKLDIGVSTESTLLSNTIVTNDFNMNVTTGNLKFDSFDAQNIYVTLSTGGICKITTSTGNIIISYKSSNQ